MTTAQIALGHHDRCKPVPDRCCSAPACAQQGLALYPAPQTPSTAPARQAHPTVSLLV